MEAIREYLHNMFLNLPETPQVLIDGDDGR